VRLNFARYGLLDDRVKFLVGWFKDTLPNAPIEKLAVLRLDGDLYESTIESLDALYAKVSPGGYVIADDYGSIPACRKAVDDFRARHGVTAQINRIDWAGAYWQK
jgi:O-methyltransferase